MALVKILIQGYARPGADGSYIASSTTILIEDSGKKILVDPGCNKNLLLNALKKENLKLKDIDIIFLTHYHPDHILNIRLFPSHDIYDGSIIYRDDKEIEFSKKIPGTNVEIIQTPGHAHEHTALLANTDKGKHAVAGDVFWWEDGQKQKTDHNLLIKLKDEFAKDKKVLQKSREKVLKIADYIIPGHGNVFKVKK